MTSTLVLYLNSKILMERNFKVDDIETYLSRLTKQTINDYQYIKHSVTLKIKIQKTQDYLEFIASNNFNYCSIQNGSTGKLVYYFILGKKWLSESCIELTLYMDTINSFLDEVTLSNKTKILREHKSRYQITDIYYFARREEVEVVINRLYLLKTNAGSSDFITGKINFYRYDPVEHTIELMHVASRLEIVRLSTTNRQIQITDFESGEMFSYPANLNYAFSCESITSVSSSFHITINGRLIKTYSPIIDFYSEGISPVLFKTYEQTLFDTYDTGEVENNNFYLVYKNAVSGSNVECFLFADEEMITAGDISQRRSGSLIVRNVINGFIDNQDNSKAGALLFLYNDNNSDGVIKWKKNSRKSIEGEVSLDNSNECILIYYAVDMFGVRRTIIKKYRYVNNQWQEIELGIDPVKNEIGYESIGHIRILRNYGTSQTIPTPTAIQSLEDYLGNTPITADNVIPALSSIVRTDPKLIKIIKLPYSPTSIRKTEDGKYMFDSSIWTFDSSTDFSGLKLLKTSAKFSNILNLDFNPYEPLYTRHLVPSRVARNMEVETKLLHSDFYLQKFVYDSFSFSFQLEKITSYKADIDVDYIVTSTINSKFLFAFPNYEILGKSESDYDKVMPIARNNEELILNSDYIQYIKTGFNYDVKTQKRQETTTIASTAGGIIGGIVSIAGGVASENPFLIGLGITTITSSVVNVISSVNSINQAEQNIQAKLTQARMHSISVAGSDDVDLMSYYTEGNKAKFCIYEVSPKMKQALYDLFYYTGYVADRLGVPVTTGRKNFNFVSAEIVFAQVPNLSTEIISEISRVYLEGITFLHKWNNDWDFEQIYENWESDILEGE